MALSSAQVGFIANAIADFITFSSNEQTLKWQVNQLTFALQNFVHKTHTFFGLRNMFLHPETILYRLEDFGDSTITISDVQVGILQQLTDFIRESAKQCGTSLENLGWNLEQMKLVTRLTNSTNKFVSEKSHFDEGQHPQLVDVPNGKVYEIQRILTKEDTRGTSIHMGMGVEAYYYADINIIVKLPSGTSKKNIKLFIDDDLKYLEKEMYQAADHFTAELILTNMVKSKLLSEKEKKQLLNHPAATAFFSFYFYQSMFANKKISVKKLLELPNSAIENINDSLCMSLVKDKICKFDQIVYISPLAKKICQHHLYFTQLKNKNIKFNSLLSINEDQYRILVLPLISQLILKNKISFEQALLFPVYLRSLFCHGGYQTYFTNQHSDWNGLANITEEQCQVLSNNLMAALVNIGMIQLNQLDNYHLDTLRFLGSIAFLSKWLEPEISTLLTATTDKLMSTIVNIFAKRVVAVYESSPIQNDNESKIAADLQLLCGKIDTAQLKQMILVEIDMISLQQKSNRQFYDNENFLFANKKQKTLLEFSDEQLAVLDYSSKIWTTCHIV
ncbi:MAG: hypothetical protein ACD_46C00291G0003 [uncultured bacterium]|nr:MAG: hypothetical protein ACD_46C00291G0003 [uncultured bacterium]